ncbi:AraC family transcriptional regulator [Megamonas funiformis]|uniref:AraC family transcriptional regulator n=1 Tax=Megamonas funiformis TaxID=437897 RepID=UPI002259A76A|nr:AraC family transcriptional regulator [Megamonas funiformis]MCX4130208.1 AraC family transcriptional regulator [Megamonas funiformis]
MRDLLIDKNKQELKQHGNVEFPFRIGYEDIWQYYNGKFACHWHKEVEFTYVYQGKMRYQVNDKIYELKKGQCLFINANTFHRGEHINKEECKYFAMTFNIHFLANEEELIYKKYVLPVIYSKNLSSFVCLPENKLEKKIIKQVKYIDKCYRRQNLFYELEIKEHLLKLWQILWEAFESEIEIDIDRNYYKQLIKIKQITQFIHKHYAEKITLQNIADNLHISISDCSHSFKKFMKESIFEYILHYRIQQSLYLLQDKELSILQISLKVGFSSTSYYSKLFKKYMKMTPKEYRKLLKN